jgi:hypothetical protein
VLVAALIDKTDPVGDGVGAGVLTARSTMLAAGVNRCLTRSTVSFIIVFTDCASDLC